jgi:hypothetical protein
VWDTSEVPGDAEAVDPVEHLRPQESLRAAVRAEFTRLRAEPTEVLTCFAGNGALFSILWFFAPVTIYDLLFTVRGIAVYPIVLGVWMIADVPATNQLAVHPAPVIEALDDPATVTRLLRARQFVLWSIAAPTVLTAAVAVGFITGTWSASVIAIVWIVIAPLSSMAYGCIIGVIWPYHPIPLRQRFAARVDRKHLWLRWSVLVVLPYAVIPALTLAALAPITVVWKLFHSPDLDGPVHVLVSAIALAVALPVAGLAFWSGTHLAGRLAVRRRGTLRCYLEDPARG